MAFVDGNSNGERFDGGGGGAVFDRGGRLAIVNSVFTGNRCEADGPDIGGGGGAGAVAVRRSSGGCRAQPFSGNVCSNGGALSSIGVSWTVLNSRFSANRAIGGGREPRPGGHAGPGAAAARSTTTGTG